MFSKRKGRVFGSALVLPVLALALVAAACGGTDETTTTAAPETTAPPTTVAQTSTTAAASAFEGDAALIAANWETFMDPTTPIAEKVALLENGAAHQAELEAQAANPAAAAATVKITDVQITSDTAADVTFDIIVGGAPIVLGETGTAVLEDGTWKVTETSFAGMLAAQSGASGGGTGTPITN